MGGAGRPVPICGIGAHKQEMGVPQARPRHPCFRSPGRALSVPRPAGRPAIMDMDGPALADCSCIRISGAVAGRPQFTFVVRELHVAFSQ